jgi:hypothetical protein
MPAKLRRAVIEIGILRENLGNFAESTYDCMHGKEEKSYA